MALFPGEHQVDVAASRTKEVLSDDTVTTDRVNKLLDYAEVASLRSYILLEQTAVAATLFQLELGGEGIASAPAST